MKRLTIMIKPASSLCDMRCTYCFYCDVAASRHRASMGIMERGVAAALIKNVYSGLEAGDSITFSFQGGEPGLAGLDFFVFFTETAKKAAPRGVKTHYTIQTNGLMIDDAWCKFFNANKFLVGLSLDGDAALHNQNRVDVHGKGSFGRVMEAKKLLERHKIPFNILCVLTAESARRARRIWGFILKENIRHIQFIPCLGPLDDVGVYGAALTGKRFFQFYADLFPLWKAEAHNGNVISVRLFEDLSGIYLAGQSITCGMSGRCSPQMVVEADGGVYPCDFYVLDEYRVANLAESSLREVFEAVVGSSFLSNKPPVYTPCGNCAYSNWCQGGCRRMARAVYGEECGMRSFLDLCLEDLLGTVRRIYSNARP